MLHLPLFRCLWWIALCLPWLLALPAAVAQCGLAWSNGDGVPGTNGAVSATVLWDPDGAGPAAPLLVVGGNFTLAGNQLVSGLATYDPGTGVWGRLGTSGPTLVMSLAVLANGDLCAGGTGGVWRWNGAAWVSLGAIFGINPIVNALTVLPNGELIAGGQFAYADGQFVQSLARWNGTNWSGVGTSGVNGTVNALATMANGDLVVGGNFSAVGGTFVNRIALWNGSSWSSMNGGMGDTVTSLLRLANGDLIAGGHFTSAGNTNARYAARWNGSVWSTLGSGPQFQVFGFAEGQNGNLLAAGEFWNVGGNGASPVAEWNGASWTGFGSGFGDIGARSLAFLPGGDLVAAGQLLHIGQASYIARWNGSVWSPLSTGMNAPVQAFAALPNGEVVAGGDFEGAGGVVATKIARWTGAAWAALGTGMRGSVIPGQPTRVYALVTLPNGDLVAGGQFATAGGVIANCIARWNGTTWSPLGTGLSGPWPVVYALAVLPNGDLLAGGQFLAAGGTAANNLARWDGTSWSAFGGGTSSTLPLTPGQVEALLVEPDGSVIVCGGFNTVGNTPANHIARWDGVAWSALGSGTDMALYALARLPNGHLVAGGAMNTVGGANIFRIARWDGSVWSSLGQGVSGTVRALQVLPNGDLIVGGDQPAQRFDGTTWTSLGLGFSTVYNQPAVNALLLRPNGELWVGGSFLTAGGAVSAHLARLATSCPAMAAMTGAGCTGTAGPNVLTSLDLPWIGSTARALASGLPTNAVAFEMLGFAAAATPLNSILPQGGVGCSLLVSPVATVLHVPTGSSLAVQLSIPGSTALAGVVLRQQVLAMAFSSGGSLTEFTSTNVLELTIGSF